MTRTRTLLAVIVLLIGAIAFDSYKVIHVSSGVKEAQVALRKNQGQVHKLASQALQATKNLQQQRYDLSLSNCLDQNKRHANTIMTLDNELSKVPPSQRAQAAASRGPTILLLNAVIPHRDCKAAALGTIATPGPPIPKKAQQKVLAIPPPIPPEILRHHG